MNESGMYLCSYLFNDRKYPFEIYAESFDEAEDQLEAIKNTALVKGRLPRDDEFTPEQLEQLQKIHYLLSEGFKTGNTGLVSEFKEYFPEGFLFDDEDDNIL